MHVTLRNYMLSAYLFEFFTIFKHGFFTVPFIKVRSLDNWFRFSLPLITIFRLSLHKPIIWTHPCCQATTIKLWKGIEISQSYLSTCPSDMESARACSSLILVCYFSSCMFSGQFILVILGLVTLSLHATLDFIVNIQMLSTEYSSSQNIVIFLY